MPSESAIQIRVPATANLMVDSADRTNFDVSPWDFQITKSNSIMNGFFNRIATTEVVLEWCVPNLINSPTIIVDISGVAVVDTALDINLSDGFYTVEDCLDALVSTLNLLNTAGCVFSVVNLSGFIYIDCSGGSFRINTETTLSSILFSDAAGLPTVYSVAKLISECADLRRYRYIDFTSSQLTYNQDLKDNSTAIINRDVLCRWYMSWDAEPNYDAYGFPILMGYRKFVLRRLFNPPKQIRWSNNQPLGNIAFQVFGNDGVLLDPAASGAGNQNNWLMTLQFSEN
jgi:hypothetical protein